MEQWPQFYKQLLRAILKNVGLIFLILSVNQKVFSSILTIADNIQNKIESNLYHFKPYIQSHYAIRMFRLTGNQKYLYPIIFNQLAAKIQYENLNRKIKWNHNLDLGFKMDLDENFDAMNKWEKRKYIINHFPEIELKLQMLYILTIASDLNLMNSTLYPNSNHVIEQLKKDSMQLKRFLLNPILIKYASPNIAFHVYALRNLKIIDITNDYQEAFQKVFEEKMARQLTDAEYTEKIYGMTHIIFAASSYYQHKVPREDFNWIYDYFDSHIDDIISRLKYDIIIEVGICYLLADNITNRQPIDKIRQYIKQRYDPITNVINEPWDRGRIEKAEHRNVLTILFLKWNNNLHPGPDLLNSEPFKVIMKPRDPL
jgi:hypothetical protein